MQYLSCEEEMCGSSYSVRKRNYSETKSLADIGGYWLVAGNVDCYRNANEVMTRELAAVLSVVSFSKA
jgi:hypothetical protein